MLIDKYVHTYTIVKNKLQYLPLIYTVIHMIQENLFVFK